MLAHNHPAFHAISARCPGQSAKHKHAAWGINAKTKHFATSEETAYPMGLAKMIANCFVVALQARGVRMPAQSMLEVDDLSSSYLRKLRATAGVQRRAFKIPPLVPTFKRKIQTKTDSNTTAFKLFQKISKQFSDELLKGSKLLAIAPLLPTTIGGDDKTVEHQGDDRTVDQRHCSEERVQTWGVPGRPRSLSSRQPWQNTPCSWTSCFQKGCKKW